MGSTSTRQGTLRRGTKSRREGKAGERGVTAEGLRETRGRGRTQGKPPRDNVRKPRVCGAPVSRAHRGRPRRVWKTESESDRDAWRTPAKIRPCRAVWCPRRWGHAARKPTRCSHTPARVAASTSSCPAARPGPGSPTLCRGTHAGAVALRIGLAIPCGTGDGTTVRPSPSRGALGRVSQRNGNS